MAEETLRPIQAQAAQPDSGAGTVVIRYDCARDAFTYGASVGLKLCGRYDGRPLWNILLDDGVATADDIGAMRRLMERARTDATAEGCEVRVQLVAADGRLLHAAMRVAAEYDETGAATEITLLFMDTEAALRREEALQALNETDALTGLLRRSVFVARVNRRIAENPPRAYLVAYFDIDKFGVINDRFGHQAGDEFLRFFARHVQSTFGEDALCCRITADYFAAYMRNDLALIDRFNNEYQAHLRAEQAVFEITVSFGFCVVDDAALSADMALDRASLAQKSIKGNYLKHYAFYDDTMRNARLRQQEIVGQMNAALTQGQFDIYIQPQYDLGSGALIGGETLARWFHPEKGIIMPAEFIPIFEQNGFISKLDGYVWERACRLLQRWIAEDGERALSLSVNISRVNLFNMDVGEQLSALTQRYGVPPHMLRLEVTESAYADNPQTLIDLVTDLQGRGFCVEMDDFGSGYSSLNTLKDVSVNALKLDLRFLGGGTSGRGGSIINSVIRMAKWLQLPVVAEGVETRQQADYLRSIGCDYAQGYLYSRPVPVTEFEALMRTQPRAARDEAPFYVDMADANAFWNPDSQETLIFNSYVGGAAIMEYAGQSVTLLRANDKFRRMMRLDGDSSLSVLSRMPAKERKLYLKMLDDAIATNDETTCTTCLIAADGERRETWLRNRARVLASSRTYTIFYVAIDDVSAENEAQRRFHISQDTLMAAAAHTHLQYWTYNLIEHTSIQGVEGHEYESGVPDYLTNYPQSLIDLGYVHPDYADRYLQLHWDLQAGAKQVAADVMTGGPGKWEWRKVRYTAVVDGDGVVRTAIGTSEELSAYKQLETRFMTAARQSGLLIWTLNIGARAINTEMLSEQGVMEDAAIADMPAAFIRLGRVHPDDADAFSRFYEEIYEGQTRSSCLARFKSAPLRTEDWRWHKLVLSVVSDKDGSTGLAVGTAVDVNEQVHMQRRYKEALAYYENLDPREYVSIRHANITHGTVESATGVLRYDDMLRSWLQNVPVDDEKTMLAAALNAQRLIYEYEKGASRFSYEYRLTLSDGRVRWVRTIVRLLMDTSTLALFGFLYTRDINEERMQQSVFSRIVLEDYDFLTIIDTEQDRYTMFVVDENDAFLPSEAEYSFTDAAEVYALKTAHPDDAYTYIRETRIPHMLDRLAREGGSYSFLYRSVEEDGTPVLKRITLRLIDEYTRHVCLTRMNVQRLSEPVADAEAAEEISERPKQA